MNAKSDSFASIIDDKFLAGDIRPNRRKFPLHLACTQLKVGQALRRPKEGIYALRKMTPADVAELRSMVYASMPTRNGLPFIPQSKFG